MLRTLISLAVSIALMVVAAGLGRRLRKLAGWGSAPASESLVIDTSMGLGAVSLVLFALCALQILRPVPGVICALLLAAVSVTALPEVWGDLWAVVRKALRPTSLCSCLICELLLVLAIAALIPALAPPAMDDWDSLAYHLAVPKLYIQHGGFYYIPFSTHSNFPFLVEMLYIPGLALNDPVAAKLIHYWMGVLLVAAVVMLARRHVKPEAAPLAALAVAGMPIVLWEATTAYVDLATALYTVVSVHLLLNHLDTRSDGRYEGRPLLGCACAAGFAASTKMIGLSLIPMLGVWLIAAGGAGRWRRAAGFCAVAALVCLPWYAKSVVYTGSPVYPFFYSLFGGRDWTVELARNYTTLQKHFGIGHSPGAFLLLPYSTTFLSEAFYDRPGLYVGPLLLIALPVLVFARYGSGKLWGMLLFVLAQIALWFGLSQQSRYLIPGFAVLAVLVAGLAHLDDRLKRTRTVLSAAFAAIAVFGLAVTLWPMIRETTKVAVGAESREAYLMRRLDVYAAQQFINGNLPRRSKVALYGDTRGFYLDRPYAWADWGHNTMFSRNFGSAKDLAAYLRRKGFTHAIVNFGVAFSKRDKAKATSLRVYEAIESGEFEHVYPSGLDGSVAVYSIR